MALQAPTEGDNQMVGLILGKNTSENLTLKLFTAPTSLAKADTAATYTECAIAGYAAKTLVAATWGTPASGASSYSAQVFNFTASGTVMGYFIVGATSGKVYISELFNGTTGYAVTNGSSITVTPTLTLN